MELLRLLVKAGPNPDLCRLLFSNFSLFLSFLEVNATGTPPPGQAAPASAPASEAASGSPGSGGGGGGGGVGGRRLYFASPVARLMGIVVHGDVALVKSVSDDHLTQLTMAATRNR